MRVLYGVTGCGLGHTMRSLAIANHLTKRGHTVRLAASGRAVDVLRRHGHDVIAIDGMDMEFSRGAMKRARTILRLIDRAPEATMRNARVALDHIAGFDPQAMITDFDSFVSVLGAVWGKKTISVDHQHVLDRCRHPRFIERRIRTLRAARAFCRIKTPGCAHYVVTSFFFPEPRRPRTTLVGPVVREAVERAAPSIGDHVLVYQTSSTDPHLIEALRAVRARFVVYGMGEERILGNVELRRFDEARFVEELASARAVVANGGFTTISEALVLGKPVLSVPVRGQPEQELNAAYLDALGAGMAARSIGPGVLERFLKAKFHPMLDPRIRTGTRDACEIIDRSLR